MKKPSIEYDLAFLKSAVEDLDAYLSSRVVYWPIIGAVVPGNQLFPRFTLGWLLLFQIRCGGYQLTPVQSQLIQKLNINIDTIRTRRRVAWEQKAAQDFRARLTLWRNFLEEYREKPEDHYDRYGYEVQRRVMLSLLKDETRNLFDADIELLSGLDLLVRSVFVPGEFVWYQGFADVFTAERFWYLYGKLRV